MPHPDGPIGPPHQRHGRGPEWLVRVDGKVGREQFAAHLISLGHALETNGVLLINGTTVVIPDDVEFVLCHERTPHGSKALVVRVEWLDERSDAAVSSSAADLVISPQAAA